MDCELTLKFKKLDRGFFGTHTVDVRVDTNTGCVMIIRAVGVVRLPVGIPDQEGVENSAAAVVARLLPLVARSPSAVSSLKR